MLELTSEPFRGQNSKTLGRVDFPAGPMQSLELLKLRFDFIVKVVT